jgi:para-nitrobenzyl esterase
VTVLLDGIGLSKPKQRLAELALKVPRRQREDCLAVNVVAPVGATGLPVMVWIHGGDQTDGSGTDPFYTSSGLAERGCVLVTFNYRLGVFGWFSHPELSAEAGGVSGNYGLLDQIAALRWVRDNIESFGGDPDSVTIFGESAGGEGVLNLMTAPSARGLFHRAIAESPADSGRWLRLREPAIDFEPAEVTGRRFADVAVGPGPGQLGRLRAMDAEVLNELYRAHPEFGRSFYPVIDGDILPESPTSAFSHGRQAPVPLVIGCNADEATLFAPVMHPAGPEFPAPINGPSSVSPAELRRCLELSYGSIDVVDRLFDAYPGLEYGDLGARLRFGTDHVFRSHVDHAARCHAAAGLPAFRYRFAAVSASPRQTVGAFHGAEIPYVFGGRLPGMPQAPDQHLLARDMGDRWYAFAATGSPDFPGRPAWPRFDPNDPRQMVFDRPHGRVEPCPSEPGLELMRERIVLLDTAPAAANTAPAAANTAPAAANTAPAPANTASAAARS